MTRDEEPGGPLSTALRDAGLTVVYAPVLTRRVVDDAGDAIRSLGPQDWLVLTSVFAVDAVAQAPAPAARVAVVGDATREAAEGRGFRIELVSPSGDGKGLFDALRGVAVRGRVCYPRSSLAKVPEPWADVELHCPVVYETIPRPFDRAVCDRADVCCVTSPSAVESIRSAGVGFNSIRFASIGPTTSAALVRYNVRAWVESPKPSFAALATAIASQRLD